MPERCLRCRLFGHRWRHHTSVDVAGDVVATVTVRRCKRCPRSEFVAATRELLR